MRRFGHLVVRSSAWLAVTCAAPVLLAQTAFAPPGRGQPGLAVGVDAKGVLRAKLCSKAPCSVEAGLDLKVPNSLGGQLARARFYVVRIGDERRAIVITVPGAADGQAFESVVVAPLGGAAPRVVFSGLTGLVEGPDGVRQGKSVTIFEPDATGVNSIIVGLEREDLDLCGRRAVLSPELLNPNDLKLHPARVQRLTPEQREQATRLVAAELPADTPASTGNVLRALGASSAIGAPQGITDGRLDTAWVENRGGSGRGEFVIMSAPPNLPISGFDLAFAAPETQIDPKNVPRELWLVTRSHVFHLTLPESAATRAGARFRVTLQSPVQTDCVALVQESAFVEHPEARVAVAQLSVTSEFENADPEALVAALAGGGQRALAAGAVLRGLGEPGYAAIAARFEQLDEGGRRVALDVIDSAACERSVPVYLSAFTSSVEAHQLHARSRLRRCGQLSAEALSAALTGTKGELLVRIANELSLVAPARAISELTLALPRSATTERRALRVALARAAAVAESSGNVRRLLADPRLPNLARLDLLRALGERAPAFLPESGQALERLSNEPSFRMRYLLIGPAAALAGRVQSADAVLARALAPQAPDDSWVRVRALDIAPREPDRVQAFTLALSDSNVRVREAAARALGESRANASVPALLDVLSDDRWPIARRAAAHAIGLLAPEPKGDRALSDALEDEAPWVRAAAAESLGVRRVTAAAPALRKRLEDTEERFEVRRAAASAVGLLCDAKSTDSLWNLVRRVDDPLATLEERVLGETALSALVQIGPPDLAKRLDPLRRGKARQNVERALASGGERRCTRSR